MNTLPRPQGNDLMFHKFGDEVELHQGITTCLKCQRVYQGSKEHLGLRTCRAMRKLMKTRKLEKNSTEKFYRSEIYGYDDKVEDFIDGKEEGSIIQVGSYLYGDSYKVIEIFWGTCDGILGWNLQDVYQMQSERTSALIELFSGGFVGQNSFQLLRFWDELPDEIKKEVTKQLLATTLFLQGKIDMIESGMNNLHQRLINGANGMAGGY